ncbi:MAG: hypothetical protein Q9169_007608 [Polycauliona sp. 2 TL-2023]
MDKNLPPETQQQYRQQGIGHLFIKKRDKGDENLLEVFGQSTSALEEKLQAGCKILVHCAMGISRSATIVCAFIMQRWGLKRSDAKQMVKSKRDVANPNPAFYNQLKIWGNCEYNIRSVISINGVNPLKEAYTVRSFTPHGSTMIHTVRCMNELMQGVGLADRI